jgi:endonuclease/exonuclease/phosphatase family metal-dependent hydrolase
MQYLPWMIKDLSLLRTQVRNSPVVMLQELFNRFTSLPLPTLFPDYYIARGKLKGFALVNSGLVTMSKYPILSHEFIEFRNFNSTTADALSNKGFLACVIQLPAGNVCFINSHLQSCDHSDYDPVVKNQIREIFLYARNLAIPFIIGADFNIDYRNLYEDLYSPARIVAPLQPTIYINLDTADTSPRPKTGYRPFTLDYFLVHPDIQTQQTETEENDYSDHNPVFLHLL